MALAGLAPRLPAQEQSPVNLMCPVMTDEEVVTKYSVEWEGRVIGLCCLKCQRKFLDDPQAYAANLPPVPVETSATQAGAQGDLDAPGTPIGAREVPAEALAAGELYARAHPLFVHFPIALLVAAALAEAFSALRGRAGPAPATRFCAGLAAVAAFFAASSGWQRAEAFTPLPGTEDALELHRWFAVGTTSLALLLGAAAFRAARSPAAARALRWGLFVAAPLVAVAAHFGGTLVYGPGFPFGR